jgi:hypothetical protein
VERGECVVWIVFDKWDVYSILAVDCGGVSLRFVYERK